MKKSKFDWELDDVEIIGDKPKAKSAESAADRCVKCGAAIADGKCPNGHGEKPAVESSAPGTVTLFGLTLTRGAAFESNESLPAISELHTGCMVEDARHDPDKGDYHIRVIEAGANKKKRRIFPNSTIENAKLEMYADKKMYLNHDREAEKSGDVRKVEDWVGIVKTPWLVKSAEAGAGGVSAIDAIAHVFPNARDGFAQNMRDLDYRRALGTSQVYHYKGYYAEEQATRQVWEVIDQMTAIDSVDFVTEAGARGRGMESESKEGADAPKENAVDFKTLTVEQLREARPDLIQSIGDAALAVRTAHESDAEEVTKLKTDLTTAQQAATTAQAQLRDIEIARTAESVVTAEGSGIPSTVRAEVVADVTTTVKGLAPAETEGAKLKTAVESVVKTKSELLRKASGKPSADVPTGRRDAGAETDARKGETVIRSFLRH